MNEPLTITFQGLVTEGDAYRVDYTQPEGDILIGGMDFAWNVQNAFQVGIKPQKVGVRILDGAPEQVYGSLVMDLGWGYSDYTPMDADKLEIEGKDILAALRRRLGKTVTVVVSNEPTYFVVEADASALEIGG